MEEEDLTLFPYCCSLDFLQYDYDSTDSEDGLCIPINHTGPIIQLRRARSTRKSKPKPDSKSSSSPVESSIISNPSESVVPKKRPRTLSDLSSTSPSPSKCVKRYEFDITILDAIISQGTRVTVVELLNTLFFNSDSNSGDGGYFVDKNGDKFSFCDVDFQGKTVLLLMLKGLPIENLTEQGTLCWALKNACSSWPNFQLIVANYNNEFPDNNQASHYFKTFLSAFPCSCLAIPSASACPSMGLGFLPQAIVVRPDGSVVDFECSALVEYGAEYFPFTCKHLSKIQRRTDNLRTRRPVLLENLLGLDPSSRLYNLQNTHFITVSDLKEKLLGLYLFSDGRIFNDIYWICEDCQAKNRELMIVLVYNPVSDDPRHFQDAVNAYLREREISSWWVLPFNDSTSRRLWRLYDCPDGRGVHEQFIIVGPQGKFLEPRAAKAISFDQDLYPYAAEALAQEETARLRSLTLESLLLFKTHDFLVTPTGQQVDVNKALRGMKVILCLVDFVNSPSDLPQELRDWCHDNEFYGRHDIVLVVVPLKKSRKIRKLVFTDSLDTSMPWLICPPDPFRKQTILKEITLKGLGYDRFSYIAFGEDGQICSTASFLSKYWARRRGNASLPDDIYDYVLDAYNGKFGVWCCD